MSAAVDATATPHPARLTPFLARSAILLALAAGAAAGLLIGAREAPTPTDPDLLRLLQAMALLKLLFVAAATAAILWRLQRPVPPIRLGGYMLATGATAIGPGLLWTSAYLGLAALLLHGGLAVSVLLLWLDPGTGEALDHALARRRSLRRI